MYKAYKLNGETLLSSIKNKELKHYYNIGKIEFQKYKEDIAETLDFFTCNNYNGIINGDKLINNWFPQIRANVFISHSHKDDRTALVLAGILAQKGLSPFIDSCIWGYADDLLRSIDNKFCRKDSSTYDYKKRNYSTSHVHMMLTIALIRMIHCTECLMFLDTQHSISPKDVIPRNKDSKSTLSPWIYAEMEMTNFLKRRSKEEHRRIRQYITDSKKTLQISYTSKIKNIETLDVDKFLEWADLNYQSTDAALDKLYSLTEKKSINKKMIRS